MTNTPSQCGCYIRKRTMLIFPPIIKYCPKHLACDSMVQLLKDLLKQTITGSKPYSQIKEILKNIPDED